MARIRRTKKQYADLFDNPDKLFPGCNVILFPNAEPGELYIISTDGARGFCVKAGDGPNGLRLEITRKNPVTPPMTVSGNNAWENGPIAPIDASYLEIIEYRTTPYAKAFKTWSINPVNNKHPRELGLVPDNEQT